jgi:hypothetical protein
MDIQSALDFEKNIAQIVETIKSEICTAVAENTLPGVKPVGKNSYTVSISMLQGACNLSPSYYSQSSQEKIVEKRLSSAKTVTEVVSRIQEMCDTKKVVINKVPHALNDATLKTLKSFLTDVA